MRALLTDKRAVTGALCALLVALLLGVLFLFQHHRLTKPALPPAQEEPTVATSTAATSTTEVIGYSVEGRPIESYTFGNGKKRIVFVGGVHGGYEWNSVLLAYQAIAYLKGTDLPDDVSVSIIPVLNPDGLALVGAEGRFTAAEVSPNYETGLGRFNANDVDLNRNFDCKWQAESTWRGQSVSAGTAAFSEPEAVALRDFVQGDVLPEAVIFWHSQANNVYASECEEGVLSRTLVLMNTYADAAGYGAVPKFDAYEVTGDAEGWLASLGVPAVTVEMKTRESIEWEQNKAAIDAVLATYKNAPLE